MSSRIAHWIRPEIRDRAPRPLPGDGPVRLNAMENPYPWPEPLRRAWAAVLQEVELNRYPDPPARTLIPALREALEVPETLGLIPGNGSDELIQTLCLALGGPGRAVLAPEPSFFMYKVIAENAGMRFVGVPLRAGFELDVAAMKAAIALHQPAIVFLAWPNNPTGNLFDRDAVAEILDAAPGVVVIDEAYQPFSGQTWAGEAAARSDLLLLRSVSKMGLAGLRLGALIGPNPWIEQIDKARLPYNVDALTQASARFALRYASVFAQQAAWIRRSREALYQALAAIPGVFPHPSAANFILFRLQQADPAAVCAALAERGVLLRNLDPYGAPGCLQVTVGTPPENAFFLDALAEALGVAPEIRLAA